MRYLCMDLHVVLAFLLVELSLLLSGGILVLLVLGDLIQNQDCGQRKIWILARRFGGFRYRWIRILGSRILAQIFQFWGL